jgi:hypothetical protein
LAGRFGHDSFKLIIPENIGEKKDAGSYLCGFLNRGAGAIIMWLGTLVRFLGCRLKHATGFRCAFALSRCPI